MDFISEAPSPDELEEDGPTINEHGGCGSPGTSQDSNAHSINRQ
jgi:hypothetical protein